MGVLATRVLGFPDSVEIRGQTRNSDKALLGLLLKLRWGMKTSNHFPCLLTPQVGEQQAGSSYGVREGVGPMV